MVDSSRRAAGALAQPSAVEGGIALSRPGGPSAVVGSRGAVLALGSVQGVRLAVTRLGRGAARAALSDVTPTIVGAEVHRQLAPAVTEWWRARADGLEHGLTLAQRPDGDGVLEIDVGVEGLEPRVISAEGVSLFAPNEEDDVRIATYTHLIVMDADAERVPARMSVVDGNIRISIVDADARYPLVVDPLVAVEEATLLPLVGAAGDNFGVSVAVSSDGTRALVGAWHDDTAAGSDSGSAHVFVRTGATWTREASLAAPMLDGGDQLGLSVSLSGDGSRALVGVHGDSVGGVAGGSARVFVRTGSIWTQEAYLVPAVSGGRNDRFGYAVAISSDGTRAVVGAYTANAEAGRANVFVRSGSTWTEEATLVAGDAAAGDRFGAWVALSSDGTRALVGAVVDDTPAGTDAGSARVFVRGGTTWSEEATLLSPIAGAGHQFGFCVALSSDGTRAVVGAPANGAGSAHIFLRTGTSWSDETTLLGTGAGPGTAAFGAAVGFTATAQRALVGAPFSTTPAGAGAGRAHLFIRSGASWTADVTLLAAGAASGDNFGFPVALTSDGRRAVVGAWHDDTPAGAEAGSARVFTFPALTSPNGTPCSSGSECTSSMCVDGVCCGAACGGGATDDCEACSTAADGTLDGTCTPLSAAAASTVTCRTSAAICDVAEVCSGSSRTCPLDAFASAVTPCRPSAGLCDVTETCTGTGAFCPGDGFIAAGAECRFAGSVCDVAESCPGTGAACPPNAFAPSSTVCRTAAGACDIAESCTGTGPTCPSDALASSGMVCRADSGRGCDAAELCTGSSGSCPTDRFVSSGTVCRADSGGGCDLAERCPGGSDMCPIDALSPAGTECRASVGMCDPAEVCSGSVGVCPTDAWLSDGSSCPDGVTCNGDEVCTSGACGTATALDCNDSDSCTMDSCGEPAGCMSAVVSGCCNVDADCDDSDVCTVDTCSGPGGTCGASLITDCCVADADCDDSNLCTTDRCDASTNRCARAPVVGCCGADTDCVDGNPCTTDTCDVSTGTCINAAVGSCCSTDGDCDDMNTCTADVCDPTTMTCTNDVVAGCCMTDIDCDDGEACTLDSCDSSTAGCSHATIVGCAADGGVTDDGGVSVDGGAADDGGTIIDAGLGDGGAGDAGSIDDAGASDAGDRMDGAASDGSVAMDGGLETDGGCGCRLVPREPRSGLWLLAAGLVFLRRRRRKLRG